MRRKAASKRKILPDPKFGNLILAKFINHIMSEGKKSIAQEIVYGALEVAVDKLKTAKPAEGDEGESGGTRGGTDPVGVFLGVLEKVRPTVEVKSRRVGGSTYQVPIEVNDERGLALAMRWLKDAAAGRSEKSMMKKLAAEFVDAYHGRGSAMKKRDDTHRMAKANQAFAHYRW